MNVRVCEGKDKEKWSELNRAFMDELSDEGYWNTTNQGEDIQFQKTFDAVLENPDYITIFMIEEIDKAIGFVICMTIFDVWAHGKSLILGDLFLLKDFRSMGAEKAIINFIITYAKNKGYKRTQLSSEGSNSRIYKACSKPRYKFENMNLYDICYL